MRSATIITLILAGVTCIAATPQKPNILLIMADDVGCEPIGAYGGERWKTPHIDALARGGMRFDYCYSMPVCHPTRICLMTGKYPFRLNSKWGTFPRAEEKNNIAQVLKRAGYNTAVAGKWQLSLMKNDLKQPARMGFDTWSVFGWHEGARFHEPMI
jgi:arylsulfatase A-like enzyme